MRGGGAARAAVAAICLVAAAAGCRATPAGPEDLAVVDLGMGDIAGGTDDLGGCGVGPEICGNDCDDDGNGYKDADDPACTPQMLVTLQVGSMELWRLLLSPTPHTVVLDGNPVMGGGMATLDGSFARAAFVAFDSSKLLRRVPIGGGAATSKTTSWTTRDVCVFNGELIVVQPGAPSKLHRFMSDGQTEILPTVDVTNIASACASDGNALYVARHAAAGPSEIVVFGKGGANGPVATGMVLPVPDAMAAAGYARLVDLAYVKQSGLFIGLFSTNLSSADNMLDGQVMAPFALDGGVGGYIDGGIWHGVGEFVP
jgi:hypothetical protein